jgi:hypothetical protein
MRNLWMALAAWKNYARLVELWVWERKTVLLWTLLDLVL